MDNLTHGLMGIAIGMLRRRDGGPEHDRPLTHTDKAVLWASFLAAEAPDIDVFFGSGPMDSLRFHRGLTHSLLMAPVVAAVAAGLTKLVWREAKVKTVCAWSLGAVLIGHLLNDWMTGWGTRLLYPFSEGRLGLDWIPIVDLLYTLPLLAAVLVAWRKPSLRHKAIPALFAWLLLYAGLYRGVAHTMIDRAVAAKYPAASQFRVAPDLFNPLAWQFTADLGDRYVQGRAYPFLPLEPRVTVAKAPEDDVIRAVRTSPEVKPFFDQFAYPVISYKAVADGYLVSLGDIRYQIGGRGLGYEVQMNKDLQVTQITEGGF